jgi:ABC-2 type transport system ATP-binding protein
MGVVALRTENLSKRYGRLLAVDDLTLDVGAGEVFGFLGPNGAGKSTTVRMLLGMAAPPRAGRGSSTVTLPTSPRRTASSPMYRRMWRCGRG